MALAGRDIEDTGRGIVAQHDPHQREEIRDVQEIADSVGAEAFLSAFEPLIEGWNGSDREARSGDVGEPQRDPSEIADREVSLSGGLRDPVAGEGAGRMLDRYRNPLRPPVAQRSLKIHKPLYAHVLRRLDGIDRARDVGRHIFSPIVRIFVRGSAVYHVCWREPGKGGIDQSPVGNRTVEDFEPGR